ncbi:MAG: sensor histidine kinase, partial [Campylobacterales bacterium]|nr:sensor histidine kinase [Campylobacterales bacterium]
HQWRQPLGSLMVILQGFKTKRMVGKLTDDYLDEKIEDAVKLSENMSNTIDDFRNFFHPNKTKSNFFIKECIEHTLSLAKFFLDKEKIKVNVTIKKDKMIFGYYNEMSHVFLNIISNAKDALVANRPVEEREIDIIVNHFNGKVQIHIIDNGAV